MIREVVEKCSKKIKDKKEADGGYGDLGAIPTAPSNVGNEDPRKKKELFIVDGEVRENGVD